MAGDRSGLGTATTIIHEAMHARLASKGLGIQQSGLDRVEAICTLAEYHFLLSIPNFSNREMILSMAAQEVETKRKRAQLARGRPVA